MSDTAITKDAWKFKDLPEHHYFEEAYFKRHEKKYRVLQEIISALPGVTKILDIGIGTGVFYTVFPDREKYEIQGVDIVSDFNDLLKSRGIRSDIVDINKDKLPYEDGTFDLVICDSLLEHSLNPRNVSSELTRVLKPGKFLILGTPNILSARARLNYFRGRNPFWPLIDNLYSLDYQRRCAVFYSLKEILYILPKSMHARKALFLDETHNDPRTFSVYLCRFISSLIPSLRDSVMVVAEKSTA